MFEFGYSCFLICQIYSITMYSIIIIIVAIGIILGSIELNLPLMKKGICYSSYMVGPVVI